MSALENPYLIPAVAGAGLFLGLLTILGLAVVFVALKRKIERVRTEAAPNDDVADKLRQLSSEVEQMRPRLAELEERRGGIADWQGEPVSVNLHRRGQVLRLYRRGEPSAQIAAALGLSQGEVKLIVKVHELGRAARETQKSGEDSLITERICDTTTRGHPKEETTA